MSFNMNNDYLRNPFAEILSRREAVGLGNYSFKIKHLILTQTRSFGYNDMVVRPYHCEININQRNNILEDFVRSGFLTQNAKSTSNVVGLSSAPVFKSSIIDSWRAPRYTFDLRVQVIAKHTNKIVHELYINGYTSGAKITDMVIRNLGGNIAFNPRIPFYINNVQKVLLHSRGNGYEITDIKSLGMNSPNETNLAAVTIRPTDIVSGIRAMTYSRDNRASAGYTGIEENASSATFNREHTVGQTFINDIINSVGSALSAQVNGNTIGIKNTNNLYRSNDAFGSASYDLKDKDLVTEPFFMALANKMALNANNVIHTFNIEALKYLDNTFTEQMITIANVNEGKSGIMNAQHTADFTEVNPITAKVQQVASSLSKWLTSCNITSMEIHIFNKRLQNEKVFGKFFPKYRVTRPPTFINGLKDIMNAQVISNINARLKGLVDCEIDPVLSFDGELEYDIIINADILNDHTIALSIAGREPVVYRIPAFADMLFNPMLGRKQDKDNIINNIGVVTDELKNIFKPSNPIINL